MAETKDKRVLEYRLVGKDEASEVFKRVQQNAQKVVRATRQTYDLAPIQSRNFTRNREEQDVRDAMARRIKAMRAASRRARAEEMAEERLFGQRMERELVEPMKRFGGEAEKANAPIRNMNDLLGSISKRLGFSADGAAKLGAAMAIAASAARAFEVAADMSDWAVAKTPEESDRAKGSLAESLKRIPVAGRIGEASRRMHTNVAGDWSPGNLLARATGAQTDREVREHDLEMERLEKEAQKRQRVIEVIRAQADASARLAKQINDSLATKDMSATNAALFAARRQLEQFKEELDRSMTARGSRRMLEDEKDALQALRAMVAKAEQEHERSQQESLENQRRRRQRDADERASFARRSNARIQAINDESYVENLQRLGANAEARLEAIRRTTEREIQAVKDALAESLRNQELTEEQRRAIVVTADREIAALRHRGELAMESAETDIRRRREDDEKQHAQRMLDIRSGLASDILRSAGKTAAAERAELDSQLQRTLSDINRRVEMDVRDNAEIADEIRRRGAEEARAVIDRYAFDLDAMQRRRQARYRPDMPGAISGDTRLLTGRTGLLGPLTEPTKQTAKNTRDAVTVMNQVRDEIRNLSASLSSGGGVSAPPLN